MTVAIILFTQLQGAIHYPSDTNTFVLLFHRVIKPSDLFVPWICGAGRRRIITEFTSRFITSLSRNRLFSQGTSRTDTACLGKPSKRCRSGGKEGRSVLGRPWQILPIGWSVFGSRAATECLPMFADTDGWEHNDVPTDRPHLGEKTVNMAINLEAGRLGSSWSCTVLDFWNAQMFGFGLHLEFFRVSAQSFHLWEQFAVLFKSL